MISYGKQWVGEQEQEAVASVLASDWLTQGPATQAFEQALCVTTQAPFAIAMNSGTAALHVACCALGLQAGDYLWTTPLSFIASANCALYCGAKVDFIDIDSRTRNFCIQKLTQKLILAKANHCLPKIIVAVHFAGSPCDMRRLKALKNEYGFAVIEDAAHALGGKYNGYPIGACRIGSSENDIVSEFTALSFHPVKTITTGEGGALTTIHEALAQKATAIARQGVVREEALWQAPADSPCYYEQQYLGFNYRMSDVQAAIGTEQLKKLPLFCVRRQQLGTRYNQAFSHLPLQLPHVLNGATACWHIYVITLVSANLRDALITHLRANHIAPNIHYRPIHLQPYYQNLGFKRGDFPVVEDYYTRAITLPLYAGLRDEEQLHVIYCVQQFFNELAA